MPEFELNGRHVHYRAEGAGPNVLLAHCTMGHSGMWKPIIAALSTRHRVLAPDLPAHGRSDPPLDGEKLMAGAEATCLALLEREGPAHLVGLSMGAAALGKLAMKRPDLARSLTMIEPIYHFLLKDRGRAEARAETENDAEFGRIYATGDVAGATRSFMDDWGAPGGFDAMTADQQAYALKIFPYLMGDVDMVQFHPPGQVTEADFAALKPPVMVMAGGATPPSARAIVEELAAIIPGARHRVIPGGGHMSPVTHWRDVLAEIVSFLADVTGGGTGA